MRVSDSRNECEATPCAGLKFSSTPSLPPGCCPAGNASFWWHFYPDDSHVYPRGLNSLYNPGIRLAVSQWTTTLRRRKGH